MATDGINNPPPFDRSLLWADTAAPWGSGIAMAGGLVQKASHFIYKKSFSPLAGRIASHRALRWAAPVGMIAMGYNAVRCTKRLISGTSDDVWADRLMIGGAVCGVASMVGRFNPMLRAWAAFAGLAIDAVNLVHVGWQWHEGQVSAGDLLLQAGLTLIFGFDRETIQEARRTGSWKVDTTFFKHPELGKHLPKIIVEPDRVAPHVTIDSSTQELIERFSREYAASATSKWLHLNKQQLQPSQQNQIHQAIKSRLSAAVRTGLKDLPSELDSDGLVGINYVFAHQVYPRLASPIESALDHFHNCLANYARWGKAGLFPQAFRAMAAQEGIPSPAYRRPVTPDGEFFILSEPGIVESYGGVDCCLMWQPPGWNSPFLLMVAGYIRRPGGFAIVKIQGGKGIGRGRLPMVPGQRPVRILDYAQSKIGGDLGEWLTRQVLRGFQHEDPTANIYLRKGVRQLYLYEQVPHPETGNTLYESAGQLGEAELHRLMRRGIRKLEDEVRVLREIKSTGRATAGQIERAGQVEKALVDARRGERVILRSNRMARRFGFVPELPESSWSALEPGSRGWRELQATRPTDLGQRGG